MPTIEERAREMLNEATNGLDALCREIEAHDATLAEFEAYKREVSEAVEFDKENYEGLCFPRLSRFILPKPVDPLIEAVCSTFGADIAGPGDADKFRAALTKRGLKLVEVGDAD